MRWPAPIVLVVSLALAAPADAKTQIVSHVFETTGSSAGIGLGNASDAGETMEFARGRFSFDFPLTAVNASGFAGAQCGPAPGPGEFRCAFQQGWKPGERLDLDVQAAQPIPSDVKLFLFVCPQPCTQDQGPFEFSPTPPPVGEPPPGGGTQPGCSFCRLTQDERRAKARLSIESLLPRNGSFPAPVILGFGVIVVNGAGADGVNLQSFVVNSHTSAFDLSVFGFEPQPVTAEAQSVKARRHAYRAVKVHLEPGEARRVALRTPAPLKRALAKALRKRRRVTRKVTMTYRNPVTGQSQTVTQRFTVRRR